MQAFEYVAPTNLADVVSILAEKGERARILAGGTDLIVQMREGRRSPDVIVDIKHVPELNEISFDPHKGARIGASVPCYRLAEHRHLARTFPGLIEAASLIGGVQIQSRASIGGNLCNASPAADSVPALIASEAVCTLTGPAGSRDLPVEFFCTGPGKTSLEPGELLVGFKLPLPQPHTGTSYLRFIPRNEMDIAVVGVGVSVTLDETLTRCVSARISLAAVAPTPLFVPDASASLVGTALTEADLDKAAGIARAAARPISDMRGDADFRKRLVGVLVKRTLRIATSRAKEN